MAKPMRVVGIDLYNQSLTGGVAKTLSNKATDADHIPCVLIYDARGNGGGWICPTITGEHQNRVTDYTALVLQRITTETTDHPNNATASGQTEQA